MERALFDTRGELDRLRVEDTGASEKEDEVRRVRRRTRQQRREAHQRAVAAMHSEFAARHALAMGAVRGRAAQELAGLQQDRERDRSVAEELLRRERQSAEQSAYQLRQKLEIITLSRSRRIRGAE